MKISVKTAAGDKFDVEAENWAELKASIFEKVHIPVKQQRISFNGKHVCTQRNVPMRDLLPEGAEVDLHASLSGGCGLGCNICGVGGECCCTIQ